MTILIINKILNLLKSCCYFYIAAFTIMQVITSDGQFDEAFISSIAFNLVKFIILAALMEGVSNLLDFIKPTDK